jgi:hypothetical protein
MSTTNQSSAVYWTKHPLWARLSSEERERYRYLAKSCKPARKTIKTARPSLRASGRMFHHQTLGFSLFLDDHQDAQAGSGGYALKIGAVTLKARRGRRDNYGQLTGNVPASWLTDLNAGGIEPDPEDPDSFDPESARIASLDFEDLT